ncbi:uncharacterized protein MONBRDRAFT_36978 [Monosiga brevicollis MX1]|uniref:RNA helicase n=1 Tax=Monosiga brevicollis TaxID=81824 RepID=A9UYS5_MONBE|nr:uncharacterized protein MONBRDRAFT_36978 [Monosiga brevicollis MX1]EDQ89655.1 predicted protein [Monosiga brevicollis MX1]|eukprot:XP_001745684.1 hypothetical protein [Monosiga brevicollis MX1]
MAEKRLQQSQYEYHANANLVLQADRSLIDRRARDEATGEVQTLRGKLTSMRMGDRAARAAPTDLEERKKRRADKAARAAKSAKISASVLTDALDMNLKYRPKTTETQHVYELILSFITDYLGSQPQDILMGAADEIIILLKDESMKTKEKRGEVSSLLGQRLSEEGFTRLVSLCNRIDDFQDEEEEAAAGEEFDDDAGVALIFDRDEEDEDEQADAMDDDLDVVRDQDEYEDEEEGEEADDTQAVSANLGAIGAANAADLVRPADVDAYWLQRELGKYTKDAEESQSLADETLKVLQEAKDDRECENSLVTVLGFDKFEFVKLCRKNRNVILYCTLRARAKSDQERKAIDATMAQDPDLAPILKELREGQSVDKAAEAKARREAQRQEKLDAPLDVLDVDMERKPTQVLNLEEIAFQQAGHLMSNKKVVLPPGSTRTQFKGYEEVSVPAAKSKPRGDNEKDVQIDSLPSWAQKGFLGFKALNRVQSRLFPCAFGSDENLLLCAPTGAGKTNVAMLTVLREIGKHVREDDSVDLESFKIIYIAPMKSLVAEMTGSFRKRLEPYGLRVEELTGDQSLTRDQIYNTNLLVCTPEKWDVITRKGGFEGIVGLVIIDEIHLLHDSRGAVLESIIARHLRQVEQGGERLRLVGLSATLPNYEDVATLLRVDPSKGLFFFDGSYRPCPLQQQYIGITERKAIKRFQLMNEIVYDKVMLSAGKNQILIFTHSRKDTAKTAQTIRDMCMEKDTLGAFMREDSASVEILRRTTEEDTKNKDLKDLLPYGFACHHAGMNRKDRTLVEDLFADGHIQVLVSTATLAWGVNLPAHTVIIKGTQVYSPEAGGWTELSPLDVLQMLGRAGRPQYDRFGEGILITSQTELQYYLSLLNEQLPVESQYVKHLADNLNAEIVAGTVQNLDEAITWLSFTYLYIRMLRNPILYGVPREAVENDPKLERFRRDLLHTAALTLDKSGLIKYEKKTGTFQSTDLGRIASHYYCTHGTMATYNSLLKPTINEIELLRIFSRSSEFSLIRVRKEEKLELQTLMEKVPIPVKEGIEEPTAKVNVLLQAYISQLKLEGLALMSDMVYITQSAGRLLRAIFEIVLRRGWSQLTDRMLNLCKMVDRQQWQSMSPLRQFDKLNKAVVQKLEKKELPWAQLMELSPNALGELIRQPAAGKTLHRYIHQLPKLELNASVQPVTRNTLKVMLTITADFRWDDAIHGNQQSFWIFVEDVDGENILHSEYFALKRRYLEVDHYLSFYVPVGDPMPPQYFIRIVSDRWLASETVLPVSFRHLILPEKFPPHTELLDLQPLPITALKNQQLQRLYAPRFKYFNPIQTQAFSALFESDESVFVGAPTGSGKTVCAELTLLRAFGLRPDSKAVYVAATQAICDQTAAAWRDLFGAKLGKTVVSLTGDSSADLKLVGRGDLIVATAEQWDVISRRWKQRRHVQAVNLYIVDEAHLLGGDKGPVLEIVSSRMRYMSIQLEKPVRIVCLASPVANAKEMAAWLGITSSNVFNFHPNVRPVPLELELQGFNAADANSRSMAMARPTYASIHRHALNKPVLVFVPSRKQAHIAALDIFTQAASQNAGGQFLHCNMTDLQPYLEKIKDPALAETLTNGVAYYHEGVHESDRSIVRQLFQAGAIQVVVVSRDMAWGLNMAARLVIIQDTQFFDGKEHRFVDYPITDVLQMMGLASRPGVDESGVCVLMCQTSKKAVFTKFLNEPLPVESHLDHALHDHFNAEIVTKTIDNPQDAIDYLTYTFLYRRLTQNPNYYNLHGVTNRHLSDHLSELVETTLSELEESKCIAMDEDEEDVSPLNLGMIAAYYYINYTTIELFSRSLSEKTKFKGLLEIISSATEFEVIPVRQREDRLLKQLAQRLPMKQKPDALYTDPHVKVNLLLQAHFSRIQLPPELQSDQEQVLRMVLRFVAACVDVLSSSLWLEPALAAMELSQMIVQATWASDPLLKQVPHMDTAALKRAAAKEVESILDLTDLEDDERNAVLQMDGQRLVDVIQYCNRYPDVEVAHEVDDEDDVREGEPVTVTVALTRDESAKKSRPPVGPVFAPFYPQRKDEAWWVVIGDTTANKLLAIKRVPLQYEAQAALQFEAPAPGTHKLKLYLMCDSYLGCDREHDLVLNVKPGEMDAGED